MADHVVNPSTKFEDPLTEAYDKGAILQLKVYGGDMGR